MVPTQLLAVLVVGGLLLCGVALLPRRIRTRRSVLIHAGPAPIWKSVRLFPAFHARHGKLRTFASIECSILRDGDGEESGSRWRLYGRIGRVPYWADLRVVEAEPERRCVVVLERDSLGTERRIREHRAVLDLEAVHPGLTKTTWSLEAGLRGARGRIHAVWDRPRLQALLLDQGLRSLKVHVENAVRAGTEGPPPPPPETQPPDAPYASSRPVDPRRPVSPS